MLLGQTIFPSSAPASTPPKTKELEEQTTTTTRTTQQELGAWSLELGAKKFHEQRTTGPLLFESAPAPPSAGFIVTFEDWTLDTAAAGRRRGSGATPPAHLNQRSTSLLFPQHQSGSKKAT